MPNTSNTGNEATKAGNEKQKAKRGFAAMDPQQQRQIASKGGKASHEKGTGHEFTSQEAREAGKKRGLR